MKTLVLTGWGWKEYAVAAAAVLDALGGEADVRGMSKRRLPEFMEGEAATWKRIVLVGLSLGGDEARLVRALKALVEAESRGRRFVFLDLHSPYIRSVSKSQEHDHVYSFGCPDPEQDAHWNEFRRNWAEAQRGGALVYDGAFDVPAGVGHDLNLAKDRERGLVGARAWAQSLPGCFLATTCEFGYSLCGGVFSYEAGRELGRSLFRAVVRTMRAHPA